MPLFHGQSGSTGAMEAQRVKLVMDRWLVSDQTSAAWTSYWDNRDTYWREDVVPQDYVIGGGESNTPTGFFAYYRRLAGSTFNTSTRGTLMTGLTLPSEVWRDFSTRVPVSGETTLTDNARGDHVYAILISTVVNYRDGLGKELLASWAATSATSNTGSS